jgi:hypothetical protein
MGRHGVDTLPEYYRSMTSPFALTALAQAGGLAGENLDDLVQVPVGGGPRDGVVADQGVRASAIAEPARQYRLP